MGEITGDLRGILDNPILLPSIANSMLSVDWFGTSIDVPIHYGAALGDDEFAFWAWRPKAPFLTLKASEGNFVEGLWNQDVVEIFVDGKQEGSYLEINLSPQGAWWFQGFSEYRKRVDVFHLTLGSLSETRCRSVIQDEAWFVSGIFPLDLILGDLVPVPKLKGLEFPEGIAERSEIHQAGKRAVGGFNVCAITYSQSGVEHYLSAASPPTGILPDFHRADLRCAES